MNKPDSTRKAHANLPMGMERRSSPRFECDRGVQCWKDGNSVAFWGSFVDLSMTGCSIHTPTPLAPGSRLKMVFTLFGTSVRVQAIARTLHGDVMSVEFVEMAEGEQKKLSAAVLRLAGGRDTGSEAIMNTQAAIQRLQRWFKTNELLTRDLFQRMLDGRFDPALGSSTSPLMEKAAGNFSFEKVASEFSKR